ncbi:hypothetical protein PN36_03090 [Candidatus Thiomargarita nelsonii]|uniref:Uncharacterized protein n=1 Tax=Candidatus Thiomargarita nelsonii TaxID=1003181 RepID=A0A4E0R5J4_9GAMM|nr:hypothetical protein PN36_03090 [Candidatus Thiomargarita nelsonii]
MSATKNQEVSHDVGLRISWTNRPAVSIPTVSYGGHAQIRAPSTPTDRENYAHFDDNSVKAVSEQPVFVETG